MAPGSRTSLIAGLLLLAALRHYGYDLFQPGMRGMASKGFGAVLVLSLVWMLYSRIQSEPLFWLSLWITWEELQVALCSFAYIARPWEVETGKGICSELIGLDLGAFGICALTAFVVRYLSELTGMPKQGGN